MSLPACFVDDERAGVLVEPAGAGGVWAVSAARCRR